MKFTLLSCLVSGLAALSSVQASAEPLSAAQQAQIKKWPAACQKLVYTQNVTQADILRCKAAGGIPR